MSLKTERKRSDHKGQPVVAKVQPKNRDKASSDPLWIRAIVEAFPNYLTFHAFLREEYRVAAASEQELKARGQAVRLAAKKTLPEDVRALVFKAVSPGGSVRDAFLREDSVYVPEGDEEADFVASLEAPETSGEPKKRGPGRPPKAKPEDDFSLPGE